jgi:hypothetical protein
MSRGGDNKDHGLLDQDYAHGRAPLLTESCLAVISSRARWI